MLNIEKYKDEIKKIGFYDLAVEDNRPKECRKTNCENCIFECQDDDDDEVIDWFCSEYKEPEIDWDNDIDWERVPIDTKVEVGNYVDDLIEGYFALYLPNSESRYVTFAEGEKKNKAHNLVRWKYCKLANEKDIEKYRKKV